MNNFQFEQTTTHNTPFTPPPPPTQNNQQQQLSQQKPKTYWQRLHAVFIGIVSLFKTHPVTSFFIFLIGSGIYFFIGSEAFILWFDNLAMFNKGALLVLALLVVYGCYNGIIFMYKRFNKQ